MRLRVDVERFRAGDRCRVTMLDSAPGDGEALYLCEVESAEGVRLGAF